MLNKNFIFVLVFILCMSFIVGQPIIQQNTTTNLSVPCTINGAICSALANCSDSVINPK
jgi:hypothetical protein